MENVKLSRLSLDFGITEHECEKTLLNHGNSIGLKLMSHNDNMDVIIPLSLVMSISDTIDMVNNSLTTYSKIKESAIDTIPFKGEGWVYYLFNNDDLVYIGQSTIVSSRVGQHITNGVRFNKVYTEEVEKDILLLKEKFYIHRDMPKMNVDIMSGVEYLQKILELTSIDLI